MLTDYRMIRAVKGSLHQYRRVCLAPLWLALTLALLAGCGSGGREIRGELPLLSVEGLIVNSGDVTLLVGLRNVNDRSLHLHEVEARLSVNEQPLLDGSHRPQVDISARGREVIQLRAPGLKGGLEALAELGLSSADREPEHGVVPVNVAWQLELVLIDERGRSRDAQASGFFHPVPGRPGHYR